MANNHVDISVPGCGHKRLAELEDILSHDMHEPVYGRVALWSEVKMIIKPVDIVVPDCVYDNFIAQVMALPEKKRKMWRGKLEDKWGTITAVVLLLLAGV